jgi:hypothetical protein
MVAAPSNVFLDTVVFVEANFEYGSARFAALTRLAKDGLLRIFLTDLTLREVHANLRAAVENAMFRQVAPVLRNSRLPEVRQLFVKLDGEKLFDELRAQLDKFLKDANVTVLPIEPDALAPVIDAYFRREAPFGAGKDIAEFPDAFVLQTLKKWCAESDEDMAVVSRDKAVKAACEQAEGLENFDDLAAYLDAIASGDETLAAFVREMVFTRKPEILEKAKQSFRLLGAVLIDVDGDVEKIALQDFDFDDVDVLSLLPEAAVVEISATVTFTADLVYDEPSTGSYDNETGRMFFANRVEETVERTDDDRRITVEVTFDGMDAGSFTIDAVSIEGPDLEIDSDYNKDLYE